jgi:hypothetical protein
MHLSMESDLFYQMRQASRSRLKILAASIRIKKCDIGDRRRTDADSTVAATQYLDLADAAAAIGKCAYTSEVTTAIRRRRTSYALGDCALGRQHLLVNGLSVAIWSCRKLFCNM